LNIKHLIKLHSLFPAWSIHYETALFDDEVRHFIIPFPSYPSEPSAVAAEEAKTILVDQFLVVHALARLVVYELDLLHLFLVINRL
jgi:hypothetical protein